jgi:hypothetical protein
MSKESQETRVRRKKESQDQGHETRSQGNPGRIRKGVTGIQVVRKRVLGIKGLRKGVM